MNYPKLRLLKIKPYQSIPYYQDLVHASNHDKRLEQYYILGIGIIPRVVSYEISRS